MKDGKPHAVPHVGRQQNLILTGKANLIFPRNLERRNQIINAIEGGSRIIPLPRAYRVLRRVIKALAGVAILKVL